MSGVYHLNAPGNGRAVKMVGKPEVDLASAHFQ
jgi:hypothetical protein